MKLLLVLLILICAFSSPASLAQDRATSTGQTRRQQPIVYGDWNVVVNTDLVTLNVTVADANGNHVEGLDKNAFAVYDNQARQKITFFGDADEPVSVAIVFDVSGSMSEGKIAHAKEALRLFIQTSHIDDEFYLVTFNSEARLVLEKTRDADAVANKLTYIQPSGNTALYDAVLLGLEKVMRGKYPRHALLIISDGEDNNSRYSFNEIRQRLRESDAVIYAVGINESLLPRKGIVDGRVVLQELTSVTGGKAFSPNSQSGMSDALERIALELRHQYSIGYRPANLVTDAKWHHLKVKVTPPPGFRRVFVRSRDGYYAPAGGH